MTAILTPPSGFENFLSQAIREKWIRTYVWAHGPSIEDVRARLDGPCPLGSSRSHKKSPDGFLGIQVESVEGYSVGVDLEFQSDRKIWRDVTWLARRLALPDSASAREVLEEWTAREAAFKAATRVLSPRGVSNAPVNLGLFARESSDRLVLPLKGREIHFEVRTQWSTPWVLTLARTVL